MWKALAVAGALAAGAGAALAQQWQALKPPDAGFSVQVPGTAREREQTAGIGELSGVFRGYVVELPEASYMAGYLKLPDGTVERHGAGRILDDASYGAMRKAVDRKLSHHAPADRAGRPGREFVLSLPGGFVARQRAYVSGDRLVQLVYVGRPGTEDGAAARRFFDSLKFTDPPAAQ